MLHMSKQQANTQLTQETERSDDATLVRVDRDVHTRIKELSERSNVPMKTIVDLALLDILDFYGDDGVIELEITMKKKKVD